MEYLENMPISFSDYGLNKLLIVRCLSIDWKHRDTEINIRSPEILDELLDKGFNIRDIFKTRANQLRYIYRLPRGSYKEYDPNEVLNLYKFLNRNGLNKFPGTIYLDYKALIEDLNQNSKSNVIKNSILFGRNISEQSIINFLIKHQIEAPLKIITFTDNTIHDFYSLLEKDMNMILHHKDTFNDIESKYLWVCNNHMYVFKNKYFSKVSYKTDETIII